MLQENLKNVQAKIDAALARRSEEKITGSAVTLVAVTKNHPADVITEALSLGVTTIGENRVQEAKAKREMLGAVGRWHLIGHLQTNKAKQAKRARCRKFYFRSTSPVRNRKQASAPKTTQQSCRSWTALKTCMCAV